MNVLCIEPIRATTNRRVSRSAIVLALAIASYSCETNSPKGAPLNEATATESPGPVPTSENPNLDIDLWKQGVDFFADGTEPAWSLTMDFDGRYVFTPVDGAQRQVKSTKPDRAQDADVLRHRSVTDDFELIVTLEGVPCESRPSLTHRVRVDVKEPGQRDYTSYRGCGRYVVDPRLNDIWALTAASNLEVDPTRLRKGTPVLELLLRDRRVLGHTGCNELQGNFAIMGRRRIRFGPLVTTEIACPDPAIEERVLGMLSGRELRYSLLPGRLLLEDSQGNRLEYRKVD